MIRVLTPEEAEASRVKRERDKQLVQIATSPRGNPVLMRRKDAEETGRAYTERKRR